MFQRKPKTLVLDMTVIKTGDVIGFSGKTGLSSFINVVTGGIPFYGVSHVGIMANDDCGRLLLFESTTMDPLPCVITGEPFNGTQAHVLDDVVRDYGGKVYHYPLYRPLYPTENERLTIFLMETIHIPYDELGAMRSAGVGLSYVESLFRPQDLNKIFCSEWLAAALAVIGVFPSSNASRWNPNHLLRHLRWNGVVCKPRRIK
jgi:hypothetical protein